MQGMKDIFQPGDFEYQAHDVGEFGKLIRIQYAANIANTKLNKLIESWPLVYSWDGNHNYEWHKTELVDGHHTHQARLAFIEEIKKEPCKHEPQDGWFLKSGYVGCKYCNAQIYPIWAEYK